VADATDDTTLCAPAALRRVAAALLADIGVAREDAGYMADVMVNSDLAGHESHGMRRLPEYLARWREGKANPGARPAIEHDGGALVRLDGHHAFGHIVMRDATDLAIERARTHGIAAVAVRRSEPAGRYADFCERAASTGVAILFFVNNAGAEQNVAPPGGLHARLATNPIAVGIPRAGSPHLVVDMSTSVVAAGRVAESRDRGETIPDEWITAAGAIRPIGGFKGFGLSLVVEALAGGLTGAGTVTAAPAQLGQGALIIALDVERLRPLEDFTAEVEGFIQYVRDVPLEPGAAPISVPGERAAATAAARRADGIPVQGFTWRRLEALCGEHGVSMPEALD
jgi:hydroxycarboxylate dehydrogenase B